MAAVVYRLVGQYHRLELEVQWTNLIGSHFVIPLINQTEKEVFDERYMMFDDIAKLYISQLALLYAVRLVRVSLPIL
jgi:hypothetical protein